MVEVNGAKKHDRYENKQVEQFACNINGKGFAAQDKRGNTTHDIDL